MGDFGAMCDQEKRPKNEMSGLWPKHFIHVLPWKFNSSLLKISHPKRKGSSSNRHFAGAKMLNFGDVDGPLHRSKLVDSLRKLGLGKKKYSRNLPTN